MSYGYPKSVKCLQCERPHKLYLPRVMRNAVNAVLPNRQEEPEQFEAQAMLGGILVEKLTGLVGEMRAKLTEDGRLRQDKAWLPRPALAQDETFSQSLWVALYTPVPEEMRPVVFCNTRCLISWLEANMVAYDLERLREANDRAKRERKPKQLHDYLQSAELVLKEMSSIKSFIRWSYRLKKYEDIADYMSEIINGTATGFSVEARGNASLGLLAREQSIDIRPATPVNQIARALELVPIHLERTLAESTLDLGWGAADTASVASHSRAGTPDLEVGLRQLRRSRFARFQPRYVEESESTPLLAQGQDARRLEPPRTRSPEPIGKEGSYRSLCWSHFLKYTAFVLFIALILAILCEIMCRMKASSTLKIIDSHVYDLEPPTVTTNPTLQQAIDWIKYFMQPTKCTGSANVTSRCDPVTTVQQLYSQLSTWFGQFGATTWRSQQAFWNYVLDKYLRNTTMGDDSIYKMVLEGNLTNTLDDILSLLQRQADIADELLNGTRGK